MMQFKIPKEKAVEVREELLKLHMKVSTMSTKIEHNFAYPNCVIEWVDRKGFVSLGLYGTTVQFRSCVFSQFVMASEGILRSLTKYQTLFQQEFDKLKEEYEEK
jgi:hypothetical protein